MRCICRQTAAELSTEALQNTEAPANRPERLVRYSESMLAVLFTTFGLVFLAELGDRTQVLVAWLASRYRPWQVMTGVVLGSAAIHGLAVLLGVVVGAIVPRPAVEIGAGMLFLVFAVLAFREARRGDSDEEEAPGLIGKRPVLGTAGAFFLAELGDKTQVLVVALAAQAASRPETASIASLLALWAGAVLAMAAADGLAVLVGTLLGTRVRRQTLAWVSGALFAAFGLFTLGRALLGIL
jgi:putative Ca2+/H+ antiporter (TMEM165/GDT1 family)